MNSDQRELLCDTLAEDGRASLDRVLAAARGRRRARTLREASLACLALVGAVLLGKTMLRENAPIPDLAGAPAPRLQMETIDDSQLLALLADQGPVLITAPDGTQSLILTRPE